MATRAHVYARGLAAAVAARDLKLLMENPRRSLSAARAIAERSKSPLVQRDLRAWVRDLETRVGAKNIPRREFGLVIVEQRQRVNRALNTIAAMRTRGAARASQLKQLNTLDALLRQSDLRKAKK